MNKINIANLKIGDKVCYQPEHYKNITHTKIRNGEEVVLQMPDEYENGMVKEIPNHTNNSIRVVYNCAGEWDNFKNYTSALTNLSDLTLGWKH